MAEIQGIPAADTQSEKGIALPLPHIPDMKSYANYSVRDIDDGLDHLSRVLSTPSGVDTALLTLNYTTLLTSSILSTIEDRALHLQATRLIKALSTLPANTTVLITDTKIPLSRILRLSQSLKALSVVISDFRIFARLWGMLGIYKWAKNTYQNPPLDSTQKRIAQLQVLVNICYQILENGAYLASKNVIGWSVEKQNKAWYWSCRFWAAHVGLEFWRLGYELSKGGSGNREERARQNRDWWRSVVSNSAWLPLTLHWSMEGGLCSEFWIGVFGSVAGITAFRNVWANTA